MKDGKVGNPRFRWLLITYAERVLFCVMCSSDSDGRYGELSIALTLLVRHQGHVLQFYGV